MVPNTFLESNIPVTHERMKIINVGRTNDYFGEILLITKYIKYMKQKWLICFTLVMIALNLYANVQECLYLGITFGTNGQKNI